MPNSPRTPFLDRIVLTFVGPGLFLEGWPPGRVLQELNQVTRRQWLAGTGPHQAVKALLGAARVEVGFQVLACLVTPVPSEF